jgi:hypothetical protein
MKTAQDSDRFEWKPSLEGVIGFTVHASVAFRVYASKTSSLRLASLPEPLFYQFCICCKSTILSAYIEILVWQELLLFLECCSSTKTDYSCC